MTHDELLTKINANLCGRDDCDGEHYKKDGLHGEWFALRAVVELHKPVDRNEAYAGIEGEEPHWVCSCDEFEEYGRGYPCPTIQAIEKELA
jgi:hypothetical protein